MDEARIVAYAEQMIRLSDQAELVEPLTTAEPDFSIDAGYRVARVVLDRREQSGWRRVGRKIGFTNRTILDTYGVREPVFGYMYDRTLREPEPVASGPRAVLSLAGLAQPHIEPEIAFKLSAPPAHASDPSTLLRSVEWLAQGFEIVHCHFPGWRFKAADTIADGGLHGRYVLGPPLRVESQDPNRLIDQLTDFRVSLFKNGSLAAEGSGEHVLGSPLNALARLVNVLAKLPDHPPLAAGEIVTTGTLTAALPVSAGEVWRTHLEGLPVSGFEIRFE
jgi:2-oxo-3-hexenedioate decarboxylase